MQNLGWRGTYAHGTHALWEIHSKLARSAVSRLCNGSKTKLATGILRAKDGLHYTSGQQSAPLHVSK
jgi:hypothetical protein